MKQRHETDELRPEYDFSQMTGGVRGKYAAAYRRGTRLPRLDPNVTESVDERSASPGLRRWSGEELRKE